MFFNIANALLTNISDKLSYGMKLDCKYHIINYRQHLVSSTIFSDDEKITRHLKCPHKKNENDKGHKNREKQTWHYHL